MNIRLIRLAVFAAALLAVLAALSACGKRGEPIRPGQEPPAEETGAEDLF
jgi:predicted small lipoprotein YifL